MKDRASTASERVYIALREAILSWELQPGQPLFEDDLAEKYGVSRTPVREALRLLSREDLVRITPGRGAFVTDISVKTVVELYQIRQALEGLSAQLAAEQDHVGKEFEALLQRFEEAPKMIAEGRIQDYDLLNQELGRTIAKASGNELLQRQLEALWQQARRFGRLTFLRADRLIQTVEPNKAILMAIRAHDGKRASELTQDILQKSLSHHLLQFGLRGMDLTTQVKIPVGQKS